MRTFSTIYSVIQQYSQKYITAFSISFLLVLPNLVWMILDKGVWRGDPVGYAIWSINLYREFFISPMIWITWLFGGCKAPLIAWLGQFFVGLGVYIGSINFALLLIPLIATYLTLVLLFKSFEILFKSKIIALCGCLTLGASPLFSALSRGFWIEPLQVAIVSWFIYAFVNARKWNFYFALAQFIIAISLAMLIKVSSPLYIFGPAIAFWILVYRENPSIKWNRKNIFFVSFSLLFLIPTLVFYTYNLKDVLGFAHFAATSPLFGSNISKLELSEWIISKGIFHEKTYYLSILLLTIAVFKIVKEFKYSSLIGVFIVALFQIIVFFFAWLNSSNVDSRYFVPTLPYIALLICLGLNTVNNRILTIVTVAAFFIQFTCITESAFGFKQILNVPLPIHSLVREQNRDIQLINKLMPLVTRDSSIIFDLNPQLGAVEFQYELAKKNVKNNWAVSCIDIGIFFNYQRQEIDTSKINIETVWENVLTYKPDYYITCRNRLYPSAAEKEIQSIDKYNAVTIRMRWAIADKIKNSKLYEPITFKEYPELLVYKRSSIFKSSFVK